MKTINTNTITSTPSVAGNTNQYEEEEKQVKELLDSEHLEDRITGILMDIEPCGIAFWKPYARCKAKQILQEVTKRIVHVVNDTKKDSQTEPIGGSTDSGIPETKTTI